MRGRVTTPSTTRATLSALVALIAALALGASCAQGAITHPYTGTSFGPGGVGSGSFENAFGVTVDQRDGDVFVLDYAYAGGGRVYKFDAAGEPVDFSSTGTNAIEGAGYASEGAEEIAVDESSGPDSGDIYVASYSAIRIYAESGAYLGELGGGETCGVAVGPSGDVYVGIYSGTVKRYAPTANPVTSADETGSLNGLPREGSGPCNVAADAAGDVYVANYSGGVRKYEALQFGSLSPSGTLVDEKGSTLAVDQASGEVFIDEGNRISQYDGSSEPPALEGTTGASGEGALTQSSGVAVDHASGELYAGEHHQVEIFGAGATVSTASTEAATGLTGNEATLHGSVEPAGKEVTSCKFAYGTSPSELTQSAPCEPAPPYSGSALVGVTVRLSGLGVSTAYYYRISIGGVSGSAEGAVMSLTTKGPHIVGESFSGVGSTTASMTAEIAPRGEPASYAVEYGTSTAYGSSTSPVSIGSGESTVSVVSPVSELQPGTTYHFRFVATGPSGAVVGPDVVFTTQALAPPSLPDDRGYEMVTPADNAGFEVYAPINAGYETEDGIYTFLPFEASANGDAVTYAGDPTAGGNGDQGDGGGNQLIAQRTAGGWTQTDIQPAGYRLAEYWGFSSDLQHGVLASPEALGEGAPGGGYEDLYVHDNETGTSQPLYTGRPPYRPQNRFGVVKLNWGSAGPMGHAYAGASADYTHQLFEADDALTPEAEGGHQEFFAEENNLYESVDGQLRSVNVLPNGRPAPGATFGSGEWSSEALDFSHVISSDGSRVFWTDLNNGSLYVRENGSVTKLVAEEEATFLTASADGSKVLYSLGGELYEDNIETGLTRDLAPNGEVMGILGASEDLQYVYFVAKAVLATGASAGQSNLYLAHGGETRFIATLGSSYEEKQELYPNNGGDIETLPWAADIGRRTAEVTPSGHDVVFMSVRSLTGYDNLSRSESERQREVYVYDAESGALSCVSCDPTGEQPVSRPELARQQPGGFLAISSFPTYQLRVISEDGSRVFFQSAEPLLPQTKSGVLNVYEWERDGAGSCRFADGCLYLLSTGSSSTPTYFLDASASGDDVFMITRSQLVPSDRDEYNNVFDARVGVVEAPTTRCTGTGCQGVAASPPIFATPASVTYDGVGNFAAQPAPVVKPKPKPKAKKKRKKTPACTKKTGRGSKSTGSAKRAKSRPALCKARKAAKRVRHTNGRGGR